MQPSCCDYYNKTPYTVTPYTIAGFILFHRRVCSICTNLHHLACVYSLKLLFIKWFVYLPRVCSALPGFKAGLIPACPLPHPELGPWLSSGCLLWKAGHNAGGGKCSLHFCRAGGCSLVTPRPPTFGPAATSHSLSRFSAVTSITCRLSSLLTFSLENPFLDVLHPAGVTSLKWWCGHFVSF